MRCKFEKKLPRRRNEFKVLKLLSLQNCEGKEKKKGGRTEQNTRAAAHLSFSASGTGRAALHELLHKAGACTAVGGRLASGGSGGGSDQIALFCFGRCSSAVPVTVSKLQQLLRTAMQGKGSGFGLSLKAAAVGWGWELWWAVLGWRCMEMED